MFLYLCIEQWKMLKLQTMLQNFLQTADVVSGYWEIKK